MAVLNQVRALRDANDYGIESKGPSRGMIQDLLMEIYNWFTVGETITGAEHTGSGIFKKFGIMRRSVMSKTTDNSARLVISAPKINVENTKDFITDLDHCSLPLSAACATLYPFMIFYLERYWFNEFNGMTRYPYAYPDGTVKWIELDNPLIQFSNDRFDEEMNEFIHGYSNRFKPVTIRDINGDEYQLGFKGYYISEEEYAQGKRESGNFLQRPLTWVDVLYQCACMANEGKHYILTRYPMDSYTNQIYAKANISSTKRTRPMVVGGKLYKWYPDIQADEIGKETSSKFVDTLSVSNLYLSGAGADYDGDQMSVKAIYSEEANRELEEYLQSKAQYISLSGSNMRTTDKEALQVLYNMTLILPDEIKSITPSEKILF